MDFDVIGGAGIDKARAKRLLGGYAAGALLCGAGIALAASLSASSSPAAEDEDIVDVKLATSATAETKAPEPEPPPRAPDIEPPRPRGRAQIAAPKAVPTSAPDESDAKKDLGAGGEDPYSDGKG